MSEFCEHETFKDICGICHRDRVITAIRAENERLKQRLEVDQAHPYDGIYCRDETIKLQDHEIDRLTAEIERFKTGYQGACYACESVGELNIRLTARVKVLEEALELFACDCKGEELCFNTDNCRNFIARAALEEK